MEKGKENQIWQTQKQKVKEITDKLEEGLKGYLSYFSDKNPVAKGRILASQSLFEIGMRPSSRNVSRYFLWFVV